MSSIQDAMLVNFPQTVLQIPQVINAPKKGVPQLTKAGTHCISPTLGQDNTF